MIYMLSFREQHPVTSGWSVALEQVMGALTLGVRDGGLGRLLGPVPRPTVNMIAPRTAAVATAAAAAWQTIAFYLPFPVGAGVTVPASVATYVAQTGSTVIAKYEIPWEVPEAATRAQLDHALDAIHARLRALSSHFTRPELAPYFAERSGSLEAWANGSAQAASIAGAENPYQQLLRAAEQRLPDPLRGLDTAASALVTAVSVASVLGALWAGWKLATVLDMPRGLPAPPWAVDPTARRMTWREAGAV